MPGVTADKSKEKILAGGQALLLETRIARVRQDRSQHGYQDWAQFLESNDVAAPTSVVEVHYFVVLSPNSAREMALHFGESVADDADVAWKLQPDNNSNFQLAYYGFPLPRLTL
eukprot:COSAG02_NODE_801_length_17030_cov_150.308428_19_plen_114_part_00